jgi:hypothetical protein
LLRNACRLLRNACNGYGAGCRDACPSGPHVCFKAPVLCQLSSTNRHSNEPPSFSTRIFIRLPFALGHDRIPRHLSHNVSQRPLACSQRHQELARHLQQFPVGGHAFFCAFLLLMIGTYSVTNGNLPRSQGPDSRLSTVTVWFCQNSTGRWIQKRRQSDPFALTSV